MTEKQERDIELVRYFIHPSMRSVEITDEDIAMFLENSEQGKHKEKVDKNKMDGFNALIQGKEWRGVHMQMYEEGVLSGDMPYAAIITKETPRSVIDFMKKEMFKGKDADVIEKIYGK